MIRLAMAISFGEKAYPNKDLFIPPRQATQRVCAEHTVRWHLGKTFSIDTIFAQFAHIDEIRRMRCNVIEMETAAAFRAADLNEHTLRSTI